MAKGVLKIFGISKGEVMARIAQKATEDLKRDGKVTITGFGTLQYNKETDEYKFYPTTQLEQALKRN